MSTISYDAFGIAILDILYDRSPLSLSSFNMSQIAMPNASYDIVDLIKKHLKND